MNTPPPEVLARIEEVKKQYDETHGRRTPTPDNQLVGFLYLWNRNSEVLDVMWVSQNYLNRHPDLKAEWPSYEFYPYDGLTHSTEW